MFTFFILKVYEAASRSHPSHEFVKEPGLSMHTLLNIEVIKDILQQPGRPLEKSFDN